ncbi:rRNA-binding ribosome biosynthesis protein utp25, partial [Arthroderma sp. PD_2]
MAIHHKRSGAHRGRGWKPVRGKRKFETTRLKDVSHDSSSEDGEDVNREPDEELDDSEGSVISSGSDLDLDEQSGENSYSTLLKLLNNDAKSNEPARKRRKLKSDERHTSQRDISIQADGYVGSEDELAILEASEEENVDDDVSDQESDNNDHSAND